MIQQVGKYVLKSELGKGAMGSVWLSEHPGLAIPVAVKILDPALAAEDPDYMDRFIKEGKIAASINHQNVVRIIDAGQDGAIFYLVMEYIEGADAKELVEARGALPVAEVLELAICTAEALQKAHEAGIVHRDIKPDNILVTTEGKVKLADLGIAKQLNDDYGTTMAGTTIGTPYYIAPEQAMDSSTVDTRCDIYALGGTLYHLLTGSVPFTGPSAMAILMKHTQEELQHPKERRPDLPSNICNVVCKMMEKHPDDRYQSCQDLLKDLYAVKNKKSTSASKKKKHLKAPAKKRVTMSNLDKDLGDMSSSSKSSRKAHVQKKKKSSKAPIIACVVFLLLLTCGFIFFNPSSDNKSQKTTSDSDAKAPVSKVEKNEDKPKTEVSGNIKIINQSYPFILDTKRSQQLQWRKTWSLLVEFKGKGGPIVSKSPQDKWNDKAKGLFIGTKGYLVYGVGNGNFLSTFKLVNDDKYHRVFLNCNAGKVSIYVDGEYKGTKTLFADDNEDFKLKIGTSGLSNKNTFNGEVKRLAFWNDPRPSSRLEKINKGKFDINRADFYYEHEYNDLKIDTASKNISEQIIDDLIKDNPGLSRKAIRVNLKDNGLSLNLGDSNVKNISSLSKYPITFLNLMRTKVEDFSPLKNLPTRELDLSMIRTPISLKDLNHKTLRRLRLMQCNLKDIEKFTKFDLQYLAIKQHPLITKSLRHMKLYRLDMDNARLQILFDNINKTSLKELKLHMAKGVKNLSALRGFKLEVFHMTESPCTDLSPLKGMPLEDVALMGTHATDLSPLVGAPIKSLILNHQCKDLSLLKSFPKLSRLAISESQMTPEIEFLRKTKVKIEKYDRKKEHWWLSWGMYRKLNTKQFWEDYDKKNR